MSTSTDAQGFDHAAAIAAAKRVIALKPGMAELSLLPQSELVHELAEDIWKASTSKVSPFDPNKSKFSTFAIKVAKMRLRDHARDAQRRLRIAEKSIHAASEKAQCSGVISQTFPTFSITDDAPRSISARANRHRGGRLGYDARCLARAMYARSVNGWSWMSLATKLAQDPDFAKLLGFDKAPSLKTLKRFPGRLKAYSRQMRSIKISSTIASTEKPAAPQNER